MKLRDIMTMQVEVVEPRATIQEVAQKMKEFDIGALPVCDGDRLQGMVTDRDIVLGVVARGEDPRQVTAADVMTSPIVYAFDDDDVEDAARLMEVKQIRRLVVLDRNKRMVGIVALGDIATKSSESLAAEALEQISEPSRAAAS